jgi:hypothetical protein
MLMKNLIVVLVILLGCATGVFGATHTVTTCSQSNVQTAVNNAVPGDSIYLNCSSATWATSVTVNKGVHIYGNGDTSTTITSSGTGFFTVTGAGGNYRISNMAFRGSSSDGTDVEINGYWTSMRMDHINWQTSTNRAIWLGRTMAGSIVYRGSTEVLHQKVLIDNINYKADVSTAGRPFLLIYGLGYKAWGQDDGWGTDNFVFIEDSAFTYNHFSGYIVDTEMGGRYVFRHNTTINAGVSMHDMGGQLLGRGNRAAEFYENTINCTGNCSSKTALQSTRGGTALVYNNTVNGVWLYSWPMIYRVAYDTCFFGGGYCSQTGTRKVCQDLAKRCSISKKPCYSTSDCGTTGGTCPDSSGGLWCSSNSDCKDAKGNDGLCMQIDGLGRSGSEAEGWPCRDQTGRGKDNPSTGAQESSPVYWWNNTVNGDSNKSLSVGGQYADYIKVNRDYCNHSPATDCGSKAAWTYTAYQYPHPWRTGVIIEDTTPPVITSVSPSGNIVYSASQTIQIITNENSICAICADATTGCDDDSSYSEILSVGEAFTTTGGTTHSIAKDVDAETAYAYYASCRDTSANQNAMDGTTSGEEPKAISFTTGTAEGADSTPPVMSSPLPAGMVLPCGSDVTLQVTATDDSGTVSGCRYDTTDVAYASMSGTFDAPGGTGGISTDDYYSSSNYSDNSFYISASYATTLGQSFESQGGVLDSVRFYLRKNGTPTGNMTATIHALSETYGSGDDVGTGEALATSDTVSIAGLTTSVAYVTFTFSGANRITLVDGTQYVVSVNYSGGDATNRLHIGRDSTSPTHTGNACYTSGESWTAVSGSDVIFDVYTSVGSTGVFTDTLSSPICGQSYTYYYRCTDGTNANTSSETATFTIAGGACPIAGCVEFEDGTNASPMIEYTDVSASGGQYVATTTDLQGTSTHSVVIGTAGTYRIIARVNAADTGSDSVFLTIDEGDTVLFSLNHDFSATNWNLWREEVLHNLTAGSAWQQYQVALTADTHSFVWTGREAGARLDYFYLDLIPDPLPPHLGTTRFIITTGQTMIISPTTGGVEVIIE